MLMLILICTAKNNWLAFFINMAYNPCLIFIRTQHGSQISFCKYIFYTRKTALFDKRKETYIWLLHDTLTCVMRYFGWYFLIKMVITSICFAIIFRMMVSFLHYKFLPKRIAYTSK